MPQAAGSPGPRGDQRGVSRDRVLEFVNNELVRRYNDQHKSPGAPKADAAKPADAPVKNDPPSDAPRKDQAPAPKK